MSALDQAQDAINKMARAHKRGTGCRLTAAEIHSLSVTVFGEIWGKTILGRRKRMKLEHGTPTHDGRYLAYVEGHFGWLQPVIIVWTTKWKFLHSTEDYTDPVYMWSGPLPVMSKESAMKEIFSAERKNCSMCGCDVPRKGDTPDDHAPGCPESGPPKPEYDL